MIQASASTYYFKIKYYNKDGNLITWSGYIPVAAVPDGTNTDGTTKYKYPNGLRTLLNGGTVKDEAGEKYTLPPTTDNKGDKTKIGSGAEVRGWSTRHVNRRSSSYGT